jgi:hypothetical protein
MKRKQFIMRKTDYFRNDTDIIQLESCPYMKDYCRTVLPLLNDNLLLSRKFTENKEYPGAVDLLKDAFETVLDLRNDECQKCVAFFKETILRYLENIVSDLHSMTKGFFGNKNYIYDLQYAESIFDELKSKPS